MLVLFVCFLLIKMKNTKAINRKKTADNALGKAGANNNRVICFVHV